MSLSVAEVLYSAFVSDLMEVKSEPRNGCLMYRGVWCRSAVATKTKSTSQLVDWSPTGKRRRAGVLSVDGFVFSTFLSADIDTRTPSRALFLLETLHGSSCRQCWLVKASRSFVIRCVESSREFPEHRHELLFFF